MRRFSLFSMLALAFILPALSRAQVAQSAPPKRPMTFEDMMQMKRLGDTAVSPDGKWLAYAVTTVDLVQNQKKTELWLQAIAGPGTDEPAPIKLAVGRRETADCSSLPTGTTFSSFLIETTASKYGPRTSTLRRARQATPRS